MSKTIQTKKKVTRLKIRHFLRKNKLVLFLHYNTQNISSRYTHTTPDQLSSLNKSTNLLLINNKIAQRLIVAQLRENASMLLDSRNTMSNLIEEGPVRMEPLSQQTDGPATSSQETELFNSVQPAVEFSCKKPLPSKEHKRLNPIWQEKPERNRCQLLEIQGNKQIKREEQEGEKIVSTFCYEEKIRYVRNQTLFNRRQHKISPKKNVQRVEQIACGLSFLKNRKGEKDILFHGPSALLGVVDITGLLDILKIYKQQDAFFLLGGLYDNQVLSHNQIERLALLTKKQENLLYSELVDCLRKPTLKVLSTVQNCTPVYYLKKLQHELIEIFNFRNSQLSIQSNQ